MEIWKICFSVYAHFPLQQHLFETLQPWWVFRKASILKSTYLLTTKVVKSVDRSIHQHFPNSSFLFSFFTTLERPSLPVRRGSGEHLKLNVTSNWSWNYTLILPTMPMLSSNSSIFTLSQRAHMLSKKAVPPHRCPPPCPPCLRNVGLIALIL